MKPLNEAQVNVVNNFKQFKSNLKQKYHILRTGMFIMEKAFDEVLKEYDGNNKPSVISIIALINDDLNDEGCLEVNKDNMLTVGSISKDVVEDKETAIRQCINFISEISFHIAELEKYVGESDRFIFEKDIYDCKQHVNEVINVIFDISKE